MEKECKLLKEHDINVPMFIDERDYEVAVDKLASMVGLLCNLCSDKNDYDHMVKVCEILYHVSSSLRKEWCLNSSEMEFIHSLSSYYRKYGAAPIVLPIGSNVFTSCCHVVRAECRYVYVLLDKLKEGYEVDSRLLEIFESLSNYFYNLARHYSFDEEPFESRVY